MSLPRGLKFTNARGYVDIAEDERQRNAGTHGRPKATTIKGKLADPHSTVLLFPESWAKFGEGRN